MNLVVVFGSKHGLQLEVDVLTVFLSRVAHKTFVRKPDFLVQRRRHFVFLKVIDGYPLHVQIDKRIFQNQAQRFLAGRLRGAAKLYYGHVADDREIKDIGDMTDRQIDVAIDRATVVMRRRWLR